MWSIPSHGRAGGIVGMHYFSQVSWPVSFFVFAQLPNHSHYSLVWSLHQPISLWVVGCGPQLLHAEDLAHFINYTAHEVSIPVIQEPGQGSKDWDVTLIQELHNGFGCLIRGHICQYMLHEVVLEHKTLVTLGDSFSSKVVSMLVKSTCKRSRGVVAMIGHRGALKKLPSCCKQCVQVLMDCHIWLVIPSHQKHSCNRDSVWSQPWCPASLWHLFRVATWCAFWTTKSRRSLFSPLGIECRYRAFWWIVKFCQFHKISQPSSLEACSPKSVFRPVFSWAPSQSKTALSTGSSLWAPAQSVTCIWTDTHPAVTQTSCSKSWSPLAMVGSWTSTQCAAPRFIPLRTDLTVSGLRQVVIQISTSATVVLHPFWYSNWKLNLARAPTHQWPVASR